MNIDFHYFATYLAARVAGMGHKDAKVVAHASQYVDDSVSARIDQRYLPGLSRITPTTETNQEIFGKNIVCVYTDQIEHTARRFSAWLPPIQCTLSGHQSMMLI